jgi:tetratricopeptide (TPR) repeat protein
MRTAKAQASTSVQRLSSILGFLASLLIVTGSTTSGQDAPPMPIDLPKDQGPPAPPALNPVGILREIRIEGIQSLSEAELRAKLKSKVGEAFDSAAVEADIEALLGLKCFSDFLAFYDRAADGQGLILTFKLTEMPVLQDVQIRGFEDSSGITLKEIEEATGLKKGARGDAIKAQMAIHQIRTLYEEKGYNNPDVKLMEGGKANDRRVIIEINQGPRFGPKAMPEPAVLSSGSAFIAGLHDFTSLSKFPEILAIPRPPVETHYEKAKGFQKSGQWRQAIEEATQSIALVPNNIEAYRLRSEVFESRELYRRAIADLNRVIETPGTTRDDFINRGWAYAKDRDFDRGLADMETALRLSGDDQEARSKALRYRGSVHELRGALEMALSDYERALELGHGKHVDYLNRGRCLAKLGRHDLAVVELDQAIAIRPGTLTWYLRAESQVARGQYALALADYERAVETEPSNEWYRQGRGWGLLVQGRVDQAIEEFTLAIEGNPNNQKKSWTFGQPPPGLQSKNHRAYTGRGWAYLVKHDFQRAKVDFEMAICLKSPGIFSLGIGFGENLSLQPLYDRTGAEFDQRCSMEPNLSCALVVLKAQDARSQFLENPYFVIDLFCRTQGNPELGPNLIFRIAADWRHFSEARSASVGRSMVAARCSQWRDAGYYLDCALKSLIDSKEPGSTRPTFREFLNMD